MASRSGHGTLRRFQHSRARPGRDRAQSHHRNPRAPHTIPHRPAADHGRDRQCHVRRRPETNDVHLRASSRLSVLSPSDRAAASPNAPFGPAPARSRRRTGRGPDAGRTAHWCRRRPTPCVPPSHSPAPLAAEPGRERHGATPSLTPRNTNTYGGHRIYTPDRCAPRLSLHEILRLPLPCRTRTTRAQRSNPSHLHPGARAPCPSRVPPSARSAP